MLANLSRTIVWYGASHKKKTTAAEKQDTPCVCGGRAPKTVKAWSTSNKEHSLQHNVQVLRRLDGVDVLHDVRVVQLFEEVDLSLKKIRRFESGGGSG